MTGYPIKSKLVCPEACHGTSSANANAILAKGFTPSNTGYLGYGVYFFHGPSAMPEAKQWAEDYVTKGRLTKPLAVLIAQIESEKCLEYSSEEMADAIPAVIDALKKRRKIVAPISDADIVELIANFTKVDTVRAFQRQKVEFLFNGSKFSLPPTYHVCVRNTSMIRDLKLSHTWN